MSENSIEQRKNKRYSIPSGTQAKLSFYNEEDVLLFEAKIINISSGGIGIDSREMVVNMLLHTLSSVNEIIFSNVEIKLDNSNFKTKIKWIWNQNTGNGGLQFIDTDKTSKIENFLKKYYN